MGNRLTNGESSDAALLATVEAKTVTLLDTYRSLTGILQGYLDQGEVSDVARMEALREKYEISD